MFAFQEPLWVLPTWKEVDCCGPFSGLFKSDPSICQARQSCQMDTQLWCCDCSIRQVLKTASRLCSPLCKETIFKLCCNDSSINCLRTNSGSGVSIFLGRYSVCYIDGVNPLGLLIGPRTLFL